MNEFDAKALVQVLRETNERLAGIEEKVNALLNPTSTKSQVVKLVASVDTHRELMGTGPKPSKRPEGVYV